MMYRFIWNKNDQQQTVCIVSMLECDRILHVQCIIQKVSYVYGICNFQFGKKVTQWNVVINQIHSFIFYIVRDDV